jgi:hypothetical protein
MDEVEKRIKALEAASGLFAQAFVESGNAGALKKAIDDRTPRFASRAAPVVVGGDSGGETILGAIEKRLRDPRTFTAEQLYEALGFKTR